MALRHIIRTAAPALAALLLAAPALASEPRKGGRVHPTGKFHERPLADFKAAVTGRSDGPRHRGAAVPPAAPAAQRISRIGTLQGRIISVVVDPSMRLRIRLCP